jgi:DNA integrity scanning protein DisA with diadenylate cyclase activity
LENDARYANCHIVPFGVMAAQECRKTANKLILTTKTPILSVCHRKLGIAAER